MTDSRVQAAPTFEIVLVEPEIPQNTGNIGRTAAATGCRLHLVHPLGFETDDKALKRAGLDYWDAVSCVEHPSFEACEHAAPGPAWLFSSHATRPVWDATFEPGDRLIFGRESGGVGPAFRDRFVETHGEDRLLTLPMRPVPGIRSLNLGTAVAIVVYEGLRQFRSRGIDPFSRTF